MAGPATTDATAGLQNWLDRARPLNPGVSDEDLTAFYESKHSGPSPASSPVAPTSTAFDNWLQRARPLNPEASDEDLRTYWEDKHGRTASRPAEPSGSDIIRGATVAAKQIPQLAYGLEAGAGAAGEKVFGEGGLSTAVKEHGLAGYERKSQEIAKISKETDSFNTAYDRAKQGDFGALADWLQYGLGYAGAQGVEMLASAGIGSVAGKLALKPLANVAAERMVAKEAAALAATEAANGLAADQIRKMAVANVASRIGQTAALGVTSVGMEGGEIFGGLTEEAKQQGRDLSGSELGKALGASLAAGALEFVGDKFGLDLVMGRSAVGKVAASMPGVKGRLVRGAVAAAADIPVEGATEYAQTLLEAVGQGKDPLSSETTREAVDSAMLGGVGGAVVGGTGGAIQSTPPLAPVSQAPDKSRVAPEQQILTAPDADTAIAAAAKAVHTTPIITPEALDQAIATQRPLETPPVSPITPSTEEPAPVVRTTPRPAPAPQAPFSAPSVPAPVQTGVPVDEQAQEAATSPQNDLPQPSQAQKEAGNYQKGHVRVAGLDISIENPEGSTRSGVDADGKPWSVTMESHYGYLRGTIGKDKDHLDVFIEPGTPSDYAGPVFVVNQIEPTTGKFDEHKIVLGADTIEEARDLYLANYAKDWKGVGSITAFTMPEFKDWLASGRTHQPAPAASVMPSGPVTGEIGESLDNLSPADQNRLREKLSPGATQPELRFNGVQQGTKGVPSFELWTLLGTHPGLQQGSTYSRQTLERAGIDVPAAPATPSQPGPSPTQATAAAPSEPRPPGAPASGTVLHPTVQAFIATQPPAMRSYLEGKAKDFTPQAMLPFGDKAIPVQIKQWLDKDTALVKTPMGETHLVREAAGKLQPLPGQALSTVPRYSKPAPAQPEPANPVIAQPRHALPPDQNQNLLDRAEAAESLITAGKPGARVFDWSQRGERGNVQVTGQASTYPKLYSRLSTDLGMKKATVLRALEKIKRDRGEDVGSAVEKVKAVLIEDKDLDKIVGAFPDHWQEEVRQQMALYGDEEPATTERPARKAKPEQAALPMNIPIESGQRPIIGREATREEAPLFSKEAQTPEPEQTLLSTPESKQLLVPDSAMRELLNIENNLGRFANRSIPDAQRRDATRLIEAIRAQDAKTISDVAKRYFDAAFVQGDVQGGPKEVKAPDVVRATLGRIAQQAQAALSEPESKQLPAPKEPWQMTREEWFSVRKKFQDQLVKGMGKRLSRVASFDRNPDIRLIAAAQHEDSVRAAIREGKPVPAEVLAEYPDLKPKEAAPSPAASIATALRTAADVIEQAVKPKEESPSATSPAPEPEVISSAPKEDGTVVGHNAFMRALWDGQVTVEEYKAAFAAVEANRTAHLLEFQKMTKEELAKFVGLRFRNEKKEMMVKMAYQSLLDDFAIGRGISYMMTAPNAAETALRKMVAGTTQADLDAYVQQVAERRAKRRKQIEGFKNPQTLEDFDLFVRIKGEAALTPEQLVRYDELAAAAGRAKRVQAQERKATVQDVGQQVGAKIIETKHTRDGYPLWVVQLDARVERDVYMRLLGAAKKLGGWYSSFKGTGAVPGFQFKEQDQAEAFRKLASEGDTQTATEAAIERREERTEGKKNAAAQRIQEMADALEEKATAKLNADRLTNTARRARMAGQAEADVRADIALAKTMRNLAAAIESGQATHLDGLKFKTQVELLNSLVARAKYDELRDRYKDNYAEQERHKGEPATVETARFAVFPRWGITGNDGLQLATKLRLLHGMKALADEVADVSRGHNDVVYFPTDLAERVYEKLSSYADRQHLQGYPRSQVIPWQLEEAVGKIESLRKMGIEDAPTLRAALREFVQYRSEAPKADRAKELERDLVGNKGVGIDFFPTPKPLAARMVEEADVRPGMKVLEPSAGNGNIAEALREAGAEVDVVEASHSLREVLEAKGFNLVGQDFLDVTEGGYDRIVMNPPFSNGQDAEHVRHAYELLKPGGRLVSIMGEGVFFRSDAKASGFREWLAEHNGTDEKLDEGTFTDRTLLATTGANARLVILDKPESEVNALRQTQVPYGGTAPIFYSQAERVIEQKMPNKASMGQIRAILSPINGVKPDELKWSGLDDFLKTKPIFTKQEILDYLKANQVEIREVMKGEPLPAEYITRRDAITHQRDWGGQLSFHEANRRIAELDKEFGVANREPRFSAYQLPGGTNYRELLLTLPDEGGQALREGREEPTGGFRQNFMGTHFDVPNVLAHVRFNDRMVDGKKVLFLEEIQSDWHQKGRKEGYQWEDLLSPEDRKRFERLRDTPFGKMTPEDAAFFEDTKNREDQRLSGVTDAPFKKTWHELILRRMLRYAAENGYDKLAWTTGEIQNDRYDLSKQVKSVGWIALKERPGFAISMVDNQGSEHDAGNFKAEELEGVVGKELASKIIAAHEAGKTEGEYAGLDLKVGGEGMKGFYDDIIPAYLNKYAKKWGGNVGNLSVPTNIEPGGRFAVIDATDAGERQVLAEFATRKEAEEYAKKEDGGTVIEERPVETASVHALDITPQMKESVLTDGQVLFQRQAPYPVRPGEPAATDRQLALFALGDLDKTGSNLSATTGAVARSGGYESSIRTVANGISPDLIHNQVVDLRGYRVTSALDLAKLAQVYRDPRFETFRIIYLKGDTIVGHEGVTSRLPGSVKVFTASPTEGFADMRGKMAALQADGYYLLHNHPSGNSDPSPSDQELTVQMAVQVDGFKGHVIIDSNEYSVLEPGTSLVRGDHVKRARIKHDFGEDRLLSPSIPHPLLGAPVFNAQAVATVGKMVQSPEGYLTLLYRNFDGTVRGIQEMPIELFADTEAAGRYLAEQGLAFGSEQIFAYHRSGDPAQVASLQDAGRLLIHRGLLADYVTDYSGYTLSSREMGTRRQPGMVLGRDTRGLRGERVEQTEAPYGTEPAPRQQPLYPKPKPDYSVSEPSRMDKVIRLIQDKHIDLRRLVEAIKATGKTIADELNPVYKEEMYAGRAAQASKDFLTDELEPLVQAMRLQKVNQVDLNEYLHARHAKEANAYLRKINPDMPQNEALSGMTDEEAARILKAAEQRPELARIAKRVDAIIQKTRQQMVEYGLESKEVIDKVGNFYKYYVPLDRAGFDDITLPQGQGLSIMGSKIKRRLGSRQEAPNILAHIAMARENTIARGEKMRPVVAMAGLLMTHPNREIAYLDKPATLTMVNPLTGLEETIPGDLADYKIPRIRAYDEETGTVRWMPDPQYKTRDNVVNFRVEGKDYAIVFNEQNDRAMEIAKAFKDIDTPQLNSVMAAVAPITRYIASVNTQYNPIFGLVNFVRDIQFAMVALSNTPLEGKRAKIRNYAFQAMAGIYADARAVRRGEHPQSTTAQLWERFEKVGGPTGYRDLFSTPEDRAKAIDHLLDPNWWQKTLAGRAVTANGLLEKPTALIYQKGLKGMLEWLSDYNQTMENAVRLGVFKAGLDAGMSDIAAASIAKNITVNFNKKGQISSQMGSLYAFFNANVQGTARMFETLFEPGKFGVLSEMGKRVIVGGVTLGVLQAFLLAMAGFDEDDPPEWLRARSIIVPVPGTDKGYVSWPMPLGFNFIPTLGRTMAETLIFGKPITRFYNLLSAAAEAFYPLGGAGLSTQTIAPTAVDPLVALAENRDWTGRRIYKEDFNSLKPTPGFTRTRDSASPWAKTLAEVINYATGGSAYSPGKFSPTPDAIDYLVKQAMGGIGRETTNLTQTVTGLMSGEEVPFYKVPILGRFAGSATGASSVRNRFYENVRELNILDAELKGRRSEGEDVTAFRQEHPEVGLVHLANILERDIARLNKRKRDLLAKEAGRGEIRLLEEQITTRMRRLNDRVAAAQERAGQAQLAAR